MDRIVIFGAGGHGRRYADEVRDDGGKSVIAFLDNSRAKQGTKIDGIDVLAASEIHGLNYTVVVVTPGFEDDIVAQLKGLGVDEAKISVMKNEHNSLLHTRNIWLLDFAKLVYARGINGNVAEAGVFRGDFAKQINAAFPDRKLYLFDTFEGFHASDVAKEELPSKSKAGYYDYTSEETVLQKLPNRSMATVRKGYFPETARGIGDTFCYVNLDMDLYKPTFEGMRFFWDKMAPGGVITVHDYFSSDFPNVKAAVADFEEQAKTRLNILPIGDSLSVAIVKG